PALAESALAAARPGPMAGVEAEAGVTTMGAVQAAMMAMAGMRPAMAIAVRSQTGIIATPIQTGAFPAMSTAGGTAHQAPRRARSRVASGRSMRRMPHRRRS